MAFRTSVRDLSSSFHTFLLFHLPFSSMDFTTLLLQEIYRGTPKERMINGGGRRRESRCRSSASSNRGATPADGGGGQKDSLNGYSSADLRRERWAIVKRKSILSWDPAEKMPDFRELVARGDIEWLDLSRSRSRSRSRSKKAARSTWHPLTHYAR